jgi:hypothetical protein
MSITHMEISHDTFIELQTRYPTGHVFNDVSVSFIDIGDVPPTGGLLQWPHATCVKIRCHRQWIYYYVDREVFSHPDVTIYIEPWTPLLWHIETRFPAKSWRVVDHRPDAWSESVERITLDDFKTV